MTAYVLQSTRYHGALIKDAQSRDPKLFSNRFKAWCFKAKRRKWHWRVVPHNALRGGSHLQVAADNTPTLRAA